MNTSILAQELAPLNAQIEKVRGVLSELECEMRVAEAELEAFSADRLRFDALRDTCNALNRLDELEAGQLFWGGVPEFRDAAGHLERLRSRIARFDGEICGVQEKQANLKTQVNQRLDEIEYLYDEIRNAHAREERRKDELVIEREISPVPYHQLVMPWNHESESERRYRRVLLIAIFFSLFLGGILHLMTVPVTVRPAVVEIPKRLVSMLKKAQPKPEPVPERRKEDEKKDLEKVKEKQQEDRPKATAEAQAARKKAESTGVLAFKGSFSDLMDETPVARLGAEARLSKQPAEAAGQARESRSMVAMEAGSGPSSGGVSNAAVSRNIGRGNGIGHAGPGFARVESTLAGLAAKGGKPLSSGAGPARSDEEIQILFDRYKSALYRIYNTELRKNPTLRGKMVLRITIEPSGAVSACSVDSSNMNSPELSSQIVERVKKFNFGAKTGVPKTTILYPIDFLPAG